MLQILFPRAEPQNFEDIICEITSNSHTLQPFDPEIINFLDKVSKALFKRSRQDGSLAPLGFFLRQGHTKSLEKQFRVRVPASCIAVPKGLVFHIPPTNVDTLFLYTLAISLLAGNANIVRISENCGPNTEEILNILFEILRDEPSISKLLVFIRFGRDDELLNRISSVADVRMLWGGDRTIQNVQQSTSVPIAQDLVFPDRLSIAAISVDSWATLSEPDKKNLAENLYNDSYWFDQMACSSPQQLIFVSKDKEASKEAATELLSLVNSVADLKYAAVEGQAINKMVDVVKAYGIGAKSGVWISNNASMVAGLQLPEIYDIRPGGGFFSIQYCEDLTEISSQISRKIQTLSVFGFSESKLKELVLSVNGRGVDRIVPIGQALDFNVIWDGKDLLNEMHRLVSVLV